MGARSVTPFVAPIFLTLVLASGATVAQSAKSFADSASAEIMAFHASESAGRKQATIGYAGTVEFLVWKTISVGTYRDAAALREDFNKAPDLYVDRWADQMLDHITFSQTDAKLNLVRTTVSDLGFGEDGASLKDIYARASQLGLALCPAEVGPILRLAYLDQQLGEFELGVVYDP
jgi:hypothetical protein